MIKSAIDNVSGTATCDETGETYNLESEIVLTKAGTYTFVADDIIRNV